jgi:DNA modification methylase
MMQTIADHSVDAVIADPPYGTTHCAWDLALDLDPFWQQMLRVVKPDGVIILFAAQPFTSKLILSQPDLYRCVWYWEKEKGTNFFRAGREPMRVIEEIVVFGSTRHVYNPRFTPLQKPYRHTMPLRHSAITGRGDISALQSVEAREYRTYTHGQPTNLLTYPRDSTKKMLVPTQKPLALMEYLIETYTRSYDLVLDPTMGSGTTGVACARVGRRFHGIELNPQHFAAASKRIDAERFLSEILAF